MRRWSGIIGLALLLSAAGARSGDESDRSERIRREVERTHFDPVLGRRAFVAETGAAPWLLFVEIPEKREERAAAVETGRTTAREVGRLFEIFEREIRPGLERAGGKPIPSLRDEILKVWMHPDFDALRTTWSVEGGAVAEGLKWACTTTAYWSETGWFRCPAPRTESDATANEDDRLAILAGLTSVLLHETGRHLKASAEEGLVAREKVPRRAYWLRKGLAFLVALLSEDEAVNGRHWRRVRAGTPRDLRWAGWSVDELVSVSTPARLDWEVQFKNSHPVRQIAIRRHWRDRTTVLAGYLWFADEGRHRPALFAALVAALRGEGEDAIRMKIPVLADREARTGLEKRVEKWLREQLGSGD